MLLLYENEVQNHTKRTILMFLFDKYMKVGMLFIQNLFTTQRKFSKD